MDFNLLKIMKYKILFILLIFSLKLNAQNDGAFIIIDSTNTLFKSGLSFPYWLKAGQTVAPGTDVKSISIIEFAIDTLNGTLKFSQSINLKSTSKVPVNKTWKIESIGFNADGLVGPKSSILIKNKTINSSLDFSSTGIICQFGSDYKPINSSKSIFFISDTIKIPKGKVLRIDNLKWSSSYYGYSYGYCRTYPTSCNSGCPFWGCDGTINPIIQISLNNIIFPQPTVFPIWLSESDLLTFTVNFNDAKNYITGRQACVPQAYGSLSYFINGVYLDYAK